MFFFEKACAQSEERLIAYKRIDSVCRMYINKSSEEALKKHYENLKKSQRLSYVKGELNSYTALIWYHGYLSNEKYGLDSTLYYNYLFESKIKTINKEKYSDEIAGFYLTKGDVLFEIFDFTEDGLKAYLKASPYVSKNNNIVYTDYNISISRVYKRKNQYKKALETLTPLLKDTAKMGVKIKTQLMQDIASTYAVLGEPEKSLEINKYVLKIRKENNNIRDYWWTKNEICRNYFLMKNIKRALDSSLVVRAYLLKNEKEETSIFDNNTDLLSKIYKDIDIDKSIFYLEKLIEKEEKAKIKSDYLVNKYIELAALYEKKKNFVLATKVYKKTNEVLDSLRTSEKSLFVRFTDLSKDFYNEHEINRGILYKNEYLVEKNIKQRLYIYVIGICFFCLLLAIFVFYFYKKYKVREEEVKVLKVNEKALLEEQIKLRDNELEATVQAFSKGISILNQVKKELAGTEFTDVEKIKLTSKKVTELINSVSEVSIITDKIASKHPTLTLILKEKHPNLSEREIDYCLLTKLNLSIKETAAILNVSPGTVKVARSRIKSKIEIPSSISLKEYLNSISE